MNFRSQYLNPKLPSVGVCKGEPVVPLFLALAPPKQGLFQSKRGSSKGSRYIMLSLLRMLAKVDVEKRLDVFFGSLVSFRGPHFRQ